MRNTFGAHGQLLVFGHPCQLSPGSGRSSLVPLIIARQVDDGGRVLQRRGTRACACIRNGRASMSSTLGSRGTAARFRTPKALLRAISTPGSHHILTSTQCTAGAGAAGAHARAAGAPAGAKAEAGWRAAEQSGTASRQSVRVNVANGVSRDLHCSVLTSLRTPTNCCWVCNFQH